MQLASDICVMSTEAGEGLLQKLLVVALSALVLEAGAGLGLMMTLKGRVSDANAFV